jgi:glutamine amidotransferase
VPPGAEAEQSTCDSAVLASWLLDDPAQLGRCTAQLARADPGARLNLIVGDGHQLLATRWGDTLSWLEQPDGVLVASEPVDDSPGWRDVPERHLLHVGPTGVTVTSLDPLGPPPDPQETT